MTQIAANVRFINSASQRPPGFFDDLDPNAHSFARDAAERIALLEDPASIEAALVQAHRLRGCFGTTETITAKLVAERVLAFGLASQLAFLDALHPQFRAKINAELRLLAARRK